MALRAYPAVEPPGHLRTAASGPPRPDEPDGHEGDQRTSRVDSDIDGRQMAPGHEPLVQLVAGRVEARQANGGRTTRRSAVHNRAAP